MVTKQCVHDFDYVKPIAVRFENNSDLKLAMICLKCKLMAFEHYSFDGIYDTNGRDVQ